MAKLRVALVRPFTLNVDRATVIADVVTDRRAVDPALGIFGVIIGVLAVIVGRLLVAAGVCAKPTFVLNVAESTLL